MVRDGSHMNEEERSTAFGWLTVVMRIFRIFRVQGQRWKQSVDKSHIDENLWGRLKLLGPSVRPWIEQNFLQFNDDEQKYVLPKFAVDKLQSWILVVVLLLCNFKTEFRPFAEFFQTTASAFDKIIVLTGASMNNKSDKDCFENVIDSRFYKVTYFSNSVRLFNFFSKQFSVRLRSN